MNQENKQKQYNVSKETMRYTIELIEKGAGLGGVWNEGMVLSGPDKEGNTVSTFLMFDPQLPKTKEFIENIVVKKAKEKIVSPDKTPADYHARMRNEIEKLSQNGLSEVAKVMDEKYPKNTQAFGQ
ncbi:MAG: hypothetical protein IJ837_02975 [Clostridia bacterium]|nr:hypothetical protein [Clostridia bacterium]